MTANNGANTWEATSVAQGSNYLSSGQATKTECQQPMENVKAERQKEATGDDMGKRVNFNLLNDNIREIE